jgi:hypothetical protein
MPTIASNAGGGVVTPSDRSAAPRSSLSGSTHATPESTSMKARLVTSLASSAVALNLLGACAVVESGGKAMNRIGGELSDYAKNNDGFIGKAAGVAGSVYTSVGTAAEGAARGKAGDPPTPAPTSPASAPAAAASAAVAAAPVAAASAPN